MLSDDNSVRLPIDVGKAPPRPVIWTSTLCRDVMAEIVDGIVPSIDNSAIPRYLASQRSSQTLGKSSSGSGSRFQVWQLKLKRQLKKPPLLIVPAYVNKDSAVMFGGKEPVNEFVDTSSALQPGASDWEGVDRNRISSLSLDCAFSPPRPVTAYRSDVHTLRYDGMEPESKLFTRMRLVRAVKVVSTAGMLPERSLLVRSSALGTRGTTFGAAATRVSRPVTMPVQLKS